MSFPLYGRIVLLAARSDGSCATGADGLIPRNGHRPFDLLRVRALQYSVRQTGTARRPASMNALEITAEADAAGDRKSVV